MSWLPLNSPMTKQSNSHAVAQAADLREQNVQAEEQTKEKLAKKST